jgi:hypothetical protein
MENEPIAASFDPFERGRFAESRLAAILAKAGWQVRRHPSDPGPDLVARRKGIQYAVQIKSAPEGRGDRLCLSSRKQCSKRRTPHVRRRRPSPS